MKNNTNRTDEYIEVATIEAEDVRAFCVRHRLYRHGTSAEYNALLEYVHERTDSPSVAVVQYVARDIYSASKAPYDDCELSYDDVLLSIYGLIRRTLVRNKNYDPTAFIDEFFVERFKSEALAFAYEYERGNSLLCDGIDVDALANYLAWTRDTQALEILEQYEDVL